MMIGMMAGSAAPVMLLFAGAHVRRGGGRAPLIVLIFGLGYVVIWETGIASIGKGPATISIRHYAEGIFGHLGNQTVPGVEQAGLWLSLTVLAAIVVVGSALTAVLLARQDVT